MFPKKLNILLIERNQADFAFLRTILSEEKDIEIKIFWEKSLAGGIDFCKKNSADIDIVLLDLNLQDSSGLNTIHLFADQIMELPVVILSGTNDTEMAMQALGAGAQDFIIKGEYERTIIIKSLIYAIERQKLTIKYEFQKRNLKQIEERLRSIITNNLDGILVVNNEGQILFVNSAAEKLMGMSGEQLLARNFGVPILDEDQSIDLEVFNPQQEGIVVELQIVKINWEGESVFLCALRNISQRRSTEEAIKENEEKFKAIASSAPEAILHFDESLTVSFANQSTEKIFGFKHEEILGELLYDVFEKNHELLKLFENLDGKLLNRNRVEITGFRANGDVFPMEVSLSLFKKKGKFQTVCIIRDITDRKQAEKNLIKTQDELEKALTQLKTNQSKLIEIEKLNSVKELAAAIAHEFAQPLQALYNYLHLIQNQEAKEEYFQKSREMLNRISELTTSLQNITSLKKKDYLKSEIIDLFASSNLVPKSAGKNILVVDDEREILETLIDIFKSAGYKCKGATDGVEALDLIQHEQYDLIISDMMMPKMSGSELLRRLKKEKYKSRFILLTGYDMPEDLHRVTQLADQIIKKPISFNELLSCVDSILENNDSKK